MLVRRAVLLFLLFNFLPLAKRAQEIAGGWLVSRAHPSVPPSLPKRAKVAGGGGVKCKGCGCRGGPGYGNRRGQCVSYKRLEKECGPPPDSGCIAECTPAPA